MYKISSKTLLFTQVLLLINSTHQLHAIQAIKKIGKTIKSPLFKQIGNTIKKPIINTFSNTIKNSVGMFQHNKNTIKNVAFSIQKRYLQSKHNFRINSIKYFRESSNFGNRSIKYLREKGVKKFKYMKPQIIRQDKGNIQMRSEAQMKRNGFNALINTVSKSKPQLPLLLFTGCLGKVAQFNLVPSDGDKKDVELDTGPERNSKDAKVYYRHGKRLSDADVAWQKSEGENMDANYDHHLTRKFDPKWTKGYDEPLNKADVVGKMIIDYDNPTKKYDDKSVMYHIWGIKWFDKKKFGPKEKVLKDPKDIFKNSLVTPRTEGKYTVKAFKSLIKTAITAPAVFLGLVPAGILNDIGERLYYNFIKKRPIIPDYVTIKKPNLPISPKTNRKYDAIVFGSTGYQGGLLVDYLAKNYGSKKSHEGKQFKWAITGRNEDKLKDIVSNMSKKYPGLDPIKYIVTDNKNFSQVEKIVNQAKVVMTAAGPYSLMGSEIVNACAQYGTDYVDVTCEDEWQNTCVKNMSDLAVKSGARLVSFCGHDSVPWDLTTYFMHQEFKKKYNQDLFKIQFYQQEVANFSGGSVDSMLEIYKGQKSRNDEEQFWREEDPWYKLPGSDVTIENLRTRNKTKREPHFNKKANKWAGFYMKTDLNYRVVQRSNILVGYRNKLEYSENTIYENFSHMQKDSLSRHTFAACVMCKPVRQFARKHFLPAPGKVMELGKPAKPYLSIWAEGTGSKRKKLFSEMHFHKEPGYVESARMLAESGLSFVFNNDEITVGGGFHTPASALNNVLLKRITKTGTDFGFYDPYENPSDNSLSGETIEKNNEL